MKLEEQVCTLEQAIMLQELGIKAVSLFNYAQSGSGNAILIYGNINHSVERIRWEETPAYTVAELGEMLPEWIFKPYHGDTKEYRFRCWRNVPEQYESEEEMKLGFMCAYILFCGSQTDRFPKIDSPEEILMPTEAQAKAALLIYLLENGIITTPAP